MTSVYTDSTLGIPIVDQSKPPSNNQTPGEWVKGNLFNSKLNSAITIILTPIFLYLGYRFLRFIFVTGRWDPVGTNLQLFMFGQYPREEIWRGYGQAALVALAIGLAIGLMKARAKEVSVETGEPMPETSWQTYFGSYWSLGLFLIVILAVFSRTPAPWLLAIGSLVLALVAWQVTSRFPASLRPLGWTLAGLAATVSFQLMSGFGGWAWMYTTLALVPLLFSLAPRLASLAWGVAGLGALVGVYLVVTQFGFISLTALAVGLYALYNVSQGDKIDGTRLGMVAVTGLIVWLAFGQITLSAIDWKEWGGLHLNLIVAGAAIILAFPLGIVLAMGRRSTLPAVRFMSVAYIEFFRGAPLITFLLAAQFFLGFFLNTDNPLSLITRAIAAITLFSSAYVAEIVRGGLQAVAKGQTEAGQALGLSAAKNMRLIVLPQALRAVIPAMVGQFISLFKDTSLLFILGLPEFLRVRSLVHAQSDFRGFGIAETLVFVAFGFWAICYTMSRESQRLERRLGVGQR